MHDRSIHTVGKPDAGFFQHLIVTHEQIQVVVYLRVASVAQDQEHSELQKEQQTDKERLGHLPKTLDEAILLAKDSGIVKKYIPHRILEAFEKSNIKSE